MILRRDRCLSHSLITVCTRLQCSQLDKWSFHSEQKRYPLLKPNVFHDDIIALGKLLALVAEFARKRRGNSDWFPGQWSSVVRDFFFWGLLDRNAEKVQKIPVWSVSWARSLPLFLEVKWVEGPVFFGRAAESEAAYMSNPVVVVVAAVAAVLVVIIAPHSHPCPEHGRSALIKVVFSVHLYVCKCKCTSAWIAKTRSRQSSQLALDPGLNCTAI